MLTSDIINITKIHSVRKYISGNENIGKIYRYSSNVSSYELIFYFYGEVDVDFCGINLKDSANSLRFLPKGNHIGTYTAKVIQPCCCIDIYFECEDKLPDEAFCISNIEILHNKFSKIYTLWKERKECWYEKSMITLYDIICDIKRSKKEYMENEKIIKIENAYDYIVNNFRSPDFDYRALAESTGFSYSYFSELFLKRYNRSPIKIVTELRLRYAKELLITNRYTISEIAKRSGFDNIHYFSKVFKNHFGISPKKYTLSNKQ